MAFLHPSRYKTRQALYSAILLNMEKDIEQLLTEHELFCLADFLLRRKFPKDQRTSRELVELIRDELLPKSRG